MFGAVCGGPLVVFGPRQASCICLHVLRNSPGVRGVPAPQKKRHYYIITRPRYAAMLHCLCLGEETRMQQMSGRRRHVCLHCRATEITIACICIDVHLHQHGEPCTSQTSIVVFTYAYHTAVTCTASVRVPCYDVNDNLTGEGTRSSTCPDIEVNVAMFTISFYSGVRVG